MFANFPCDLLFIKNINFRLALLINFGAEHLKNGIAA